MRPGTSCPPPVAGPRCSGFRRPPMRWRSALPSSTLACSFSRGTSTISPVAAGWCSRCCPRPLPSPRESVAWQGRWSGCSPPEKRRAARHSSRRPRRDSMVLRLGVGIVAHLALRLLRQLLRLVRGLVDVLLGVLLHVLGSVLRASLGLIHLSFGLLLLVTGGGAGDLLDLALQLVHLPGHAASPFVETSVVTQRRAWNPEQGTGGAPGWGRRPSPRPACG